MSTAAFQLQKEVKFATQANEIHDIALVSPDTVLLSNSSNWMVQMFDLRAGRIVSEVTLQGCPQGLCITRSDQAAVAVPVLGVQIIDV